MYYITAYKRTAPVEGHTNPLTVLDTLNENKSHKITFEVASPSMLRLNLNEIHASILDTLRVAGCIINDTIISEAEDGTLISLPINNFQRHEYKLDSYKTFRIPKRSGGYREIKAPYDGLKKAQKAVYKYFHDDLKIL